METIEVIPANDLIALNLGDNPLRSKATYQTAANVMDRYVNGEALITILTDNSLTYRKWMNILMEFPELRKLFDELEVVHLEARELRHVANIDKAGANDWRASLAILERAYPDKWVKRTHSITENRAADDPEGATTILAEFAEIKEDIPCTTPEPQGT